MEKQGFISGIPASSPYISLKFSHLITRVMRNLQLPTPGPWTRGSRSVYGARPG
jgi:hypothetical protein